MIDKQEQSETGIRVTRQLDPRTHDKNANEAFPWVMAQSYASLEEDTLLRAVFNDEILLLRSVDNGETWTDAQVLVREKN